MDSDAFLSDLLDRFNAAFRILAKEIEAVREDNQSLRAGLNTLNQNQSVILKQSKSQSKDILATNSRLGSLMETVDMLSDAAESSVSEIRKLSHSKNRIDSWASESKSRLEEISSIVRSQAEINENICGSLSESRFMEESEIKSRDVGKQALERVKRRLPKIIEQTISKIWSRETPRLILNLKNSIESEMFDKLNGDSEELMKERIDAVVEIKMKTLTELCLKNLQKHQKKESGKDALDTKILPEIKSLAERLENLERNTHQPRSIHHTERHGPVSTLKPSSMNPAKKLVQWKQQEENIIEPEEETEVDNEAQPVKMLPFSSAKTTEELENTHQSSEKKRELEAVRKRVAELEEKWQGERVFFSPGKIPPPPAFPPHSRRNSVH